MNKDLKNWLAYNAKELTWAVLFFGSIVLTGVLVVWSLQPHVLQ